MLSSYHAGTSIVHRASPGIKLLVLIIVSTALFFTAQLEIVVLSFTVVSIGYLIAGLGLKVWWQYARMTLWFAILLFVTQFYLSTWTTALLVSMRLITVILAASLVTLTTRVSAMIETLEWTLRPFQRLGFRADRLSLILTLSIRFIPVLTQILQEVKEAQSVRGLERSWTALAIPVLIRTLKMADEISQAIEARAYDSDR